MKNRLFSLFAMLAMASLVAFGADIDGKWMSDGGGKGGPQTFTFKVEGKKLMGSVEGGRGGPLEIENGMVMEGDKVMFETTRDAGDKGKFTTKYSGTVSGDTMKLTAETGRGPREIELKKQ
jgi:hypothetical protein